MAQLIAFFTVFKGILEALSSSMASLGSSCSEGVSAHGSSQTSCAIIPFTHSCGVHGGEINVCLCGWDVEDEPQHLWVGCRLPWPCWCHAEPCESQPGQKNKIPITPHSQQNSECTRKFNSGRIYPLFMAHTGSLLLSLLFILPLCCFICLLCSTGNDWFCDLIRVGIICHWFCTKREAPWGTQIFIAAQLETVCNYWVRVWDWSCQLWVCCSWDHRAITAEKCWSERWGSSLLWFVNVVGVFSWLRHPCVTMELRFWA